MSDFMTMLQTLPMISYCFHVILACICGAIIGYERSMHMKSAGIRTHVIVCGASALLMIVSKYGFTEFYGAEAADPARIAAQVVSGISFLGAGVIFKDGNAIKGLTTAAGIWATAAIGLSIGAGMPVIGVFVTILFTVFMIFMHQFPVGGDSYIDYQLKVVMENDDVVYEALQAQLTHWGAQVEASRMDRTNDNLVKYEFRLRVNEPIPFADLKRFMEAHAQIHAISGEIA